MNRDASPLRRTLLASLRPGQPDDGSTLSLAEQITLQLAEDILNDRYAPGGRIQEIALSERFKVSRGPVREALRLLENLGLVRILPRRGAVVTALSAEEVADLFEIRAALFGLAARRAVANRTDDDIRTMHARLATLRACADADGADASLAYVTAVREFGVAIYSVAGNERLAALLSTLVLQTLRYSRLGLSTAQRRRQSVQNWAALVSHIESGRPAKAESAARTLIQNSRDEAIRMLADNPPPAA
ncbi:MAG: GntR family transcriptional regulator [Burkholderiaceae bacterium]